MGNILAYFLQVCIQQILMETLCQALRWVLGMAESVSVAIHLHMTHSLVRDRERDPVCSVMTR